MIHDSPSPFAKPDPTIRIKNGAPVLHKPTRDEIATFPAESEKVMNRFWWAQEAILAEGRYDLSWMKNKHFLLAGATGAGLGFAFATAVMQNLGSEGSMTVIARDLKRSLGFETGLRMKEWAANAGLAERFHWVNNGLKIEGSDLEEHLKMLREAQADRIVYVNTVAAAHSGLLPDCPPIYVKDIDEHGLFQWKLEPLDSRMLDWTRYTMGELATHYGHILEQHGVTVEATLFADWRGSLHRESRHPESLEYGRNGAYSASLAVPKDFLQEEAAAAYERGKVILDIFYPIMRTRALNFIPGGRAMSHVFDKLMENYSVRRIDIPELALMALDYTGRAMGTRQFNPFPRFDVHEAQLELWFYEVVLRLCDDPSSDFDYRKWTGAVE